MIFISIDFLPTDCYNENNEDNYNKGERFMQTDKKKRNYSLEYQRERNNKRNLTCSLTPQLYDDFTAKCELNGETKNGLIKKWIEKYTYSDEN